ncbi:MAG: HAD hydrolase-like protein [Synergistales bacterium]|nr:HAD hydrolase-like protein [Synergistales bacterium]
MVSRNCREAVEIAAERVGIALPDFVRTRDEEPVKPDPGALWVAARELGVRPWRCTVVGDFLYDLIGARRAGMRAVLVQRPREAWKQWADLTCQTMEAFRVLLREPRPYVPLEYKELSPETLAARWQLVAHLPADHPEPGRSVLTAAAHGLGTLTVSSEATVEEPQWRCWCGLDAAWMGGSLLEACEESVRYRYPQMRILPGENGITIPPDYHSIGEWIARALP